MGSTFVSSAPVDSVSWIQLATRKMLNKKILHCCRHSEVRPMMIVSVLNIVLVITSNLEMIKSIEEVVWRLCVNNTLFYVRNLSIFGFFGILEVQPPGTNTLRILKKYPWYVLNSGITLIMTATVF